MSVVSTSFTIMNFFRGIFLFLAIYGLPVSLIALTGNCTFSCLGAASAPLSSSIKTMQKRDLVVPGSVIGPYTVEKELGAGWKGKVYLAKITATGQPIALKILPSNMMDEAKREQEILESLHQSADAIYLESEGMVGIPMNVVKGQALRFAIFDPKYKSRVGELIAKSHAALDHLHNVNGLSHGDPNLGNFLVDENGNVRLIDFGKSRKANLISKKLDHFVLDAQVKFLQTFPFLDFLFRTKLWK